jgi:hypothetical protein
MRYKVQPEDFVVEERVQLSFLPQGPFAIYRVRKRGDDVERAGADGADAGRAAVERRLHSSLGYLSPEEYELIHTTEGSFA